MNEFAVRAQSLRKVAVTVRLASGKTSVETREGEVVAELESVNVLIEAAPDPKLCQVTELLFVGSQDAAENAKGLKEACIAAILNVAFGDERFPNQFRYLRAPLLDEPDQSLQGEQFEKMMDFLKQCELESN
jgi:hypothetical protein